MQSLIRKCCFEEELQADISTTCVDMNALRQDFVSKRKARFSKTGEDRQRVLKEGYEPRCYTTVIVHDKSQGDMKHLPCGGRSLLVEEESGKICARGVNKFLHHFEVGSAWLSDHLVWEHCRVCVQRKMAGFCVSIFSSDGKHLTVMSKHMIGGMFGDMAYDILLRTITPEQHKQMAQDLYELQASATCEGIELVKDHFHPVLEPEDFGDALVLFSIQRHCVPEMTMDVEQVQRYATSWGMKVVPQSGALTSAEMKHIVHEMTSQWCPLVPLRDAQGVAHPSTPLAEGLVIMITFPPGLPQQLLHPRDTEDQLSTVGCDAVVKGVSPWRRCIRLKLKTVKYVVLRLFRSLLMESARRFVFLHVVLLEWAAQQGISSMSQLIKDIGVHAVWHRFEECMLTRNPGLPRRYEGAAFTVKEGYERLLQQTVREICPQMRVPLTFVLFCGLPGSGKSTMAKALIEALLSRTGEKSARQSVLYDHVVYISRDEMNRKLELSGLSDAVLRRQLHTEQMRALEAAVQLSQQESSSHRGGGTLVILDACNSTPDTRKTWLQLLPPNLDAMFVVQTTDSGSMEEIHGRLANRPDHPVVHDPAVGLKAYKNVQQIFIAPTEEEIRSQRLRSGEDAQQEGDTAYQHLFQVDTRKETAEAAAKRLATAVEERVQQRCTPATTVRDPKNNHIHADPTASEAAGEPVVVTWDRIFERLEMCVKSLLYSLLGTEKISSAVWNVVHPNDLPMRTVNLRLKSTWKDLETIAMKTLCHFTTPSRNSNSHTKSNQTKGKETEVDGSPTAVASAEVLGGQSSWFAGWTRSIPHSGLDLSTPEGLSVALRQRFSVPWEERSQKVGAGNGQKSYNKKGPQTAAVLAGSVESEDIPQLCLYRDQERSEEQLVQRFEKCTAEQVKLGQEVGVELVEVLVNGESISLKAQLVLPNSHEPHQYEWGPPIPERVPQKRGGAAVKNQPAKPNTLLHLVIAYAADKRPAEVQVRLADAWQHSLSTPHDNHNNTSNNSEKNMSSSNKRSNKRTTTFLRVKLPSPVCLTGVVTLN